MSKSKMLVVRVDDKLLELIKITAVILERKESEAVRILLTRACKYWVARGRATKDESLFKAINEQVPTTEDIVNEHDLQILERAMKELK
jgi:hypothetical protein